MILAEIAREQQEPKPVFARSGWEIPQPSRRELEAERQPAAIVRLRSVALIDEMTRGSRRQVKIRSLPLHRYNCVGLVFANRRAWIEIAHIYDILREDGYRRIPLDQVDVGDVVVYNLADNPMHVGMVTQVQNSLASIPNIRVLSKWGSLAEVEHYVADVPQLCVRPSQYFSEKVL